MGRLVLVAAAALAARAMHAQSYEILHAFSGAIGEPEAPLIQGRDGRLYGTSKTGGFFGQGSVYVLTPDGAGGYTFDELQAFSGFDGALPVAPLYQAADGAFYGTTSDGGLGTLGTVFSIDTTGRLTTLHHFQSGDGANPYGGLVQTPDGLLYGTTSLGGAYNHGTVFRIDVSGNFESLHSFSGYPDDGAEPMAGLLRAADGNLYGTASSGGVNFQGTVFRVVPSGDVTTVANFDGNNGAYPKSPLLRASNGYFYGLASYGGLFRVGYLGGIVRIPGVPDGDARAGLIQRGDGLLYGVSTTTFDGRLFRVDPSGDNFEILATLEGFPRAGLLELSDGRLAGTCSSGWIYAAHTNGVVDTLHRLRGVSGKGPFGGLIEAADGNLYGTTEGGGELGGWGTVFRLSLKGALTTIHSFDGSDGFGPQATLLEASDGFFYGTTAYPGTGAGGSIFKIDTAGELTSLHHFNNIEGSDPRGALIEGPDGQFYGVTMSGGENSWGTIFKIDGEGALTKLHEFDPDKGEGIQPFGPLVLSDGAFYGTTYAGGADFFGTVFRFETAGSGTLTTLWDFTGGEDGQGPQTGLTKGSDGEFYGPTPFAAFRIGATGPATGLHTFTADEGQYLSAPLTQASDGDFYGTASGGGALNQGTIFKMDALGGATVVHDFRGPDGTSPRSEVLQASDGNFYGAVVSGGPAQQGVLYRLAPPSDPVLEALSPTSGRAAGGTIVELTGQHLQPLPSIFIGPINTVFAIDIDSRRVRTVTPPLSPGSLNDLVLNHQDSSGATLPAAWFADFLDVPSTNLFHDSVEAIVRAGITSGCGAGNYCPGNAVTRAQMAVFLLKAEHGADYVPPPCAGVFSDVPCPGPFTDWIEQLAAEGVTSGCGGANYCPGNPVTRAQMAVFLLKTKEGPSYVPPAAIGIFGDVPPGSAAADWIEDLYGRGITGGCSAAPLLYCPGNANTRGQMAVFLTRTFAL